MKKKQYFKKIPWVKVIIATVLIIVVLFVVDSLNKSPSKTEKTNDEIVKSVVAKTVLKKDLVVNMEYIGQVENVLAYIGADRVQGKIDKVLVSEGDTVTKGSTLFTMDISSDIASSNLQLSEIKNGKSELDLRISQILPELEKIELLYKEGAVSLSELNQLKNQLKNLEHKRDQLSSQYSKASAVQSAGRKQAKVISPYDGTVDKVSISSGTYIGQNDVIIIRKNQLPKCYIMVSESDISLFKTDETVKIKIGDKSYGGKVKEVKKRGEENLLFPVEIEIDSKDEFLSGIEAKVMLEVYNKQNAIMVPRSSVIDFAEEKYVYVIENNIVLKKIVVLGKTKDNMVEIVKGLSANDEVVVEGQYSVSDGEKVTITKN